MTLRRKTDRQGASGRAGEIHQPLHGALPLARYLEEKQEEEQVEPPGLAQLGEHVASVLTAAEAAATKLREEAENEARQTRKQAEEAASDLRTRFEAQIETDRSEARRQVALAEQEARATRADADSYAETRRREADAESIRIVRDAEQRASQLADAAAERHRVLLADISASENRMQHLATSLREVANRLEEVATAGSGDRDRSEALDRELVERAAGEAAQAERVG